MNNNNIVIIILLIVLVIILCIAIKQQNKAIEPFSFWSDLEDFFTDWGKEIICAAANDCNACGEDGTSPCSSCSGNSSVADCMNANFKFNTSTWCRHYFNQSDSRHNVPCPDITGKNAVNNLSTPENTNWIIANNRVIQINNNQYKCLALKSAPNACMDWIEFQKQMPSSTVCDSLKGFTMSIDADINTINNVKTILQIKWPAKAIRIGIFILASYPDKLVFFPQDLYTGYEPPNSHLNSALVEQSNGSLQWEQNVQNLDDQYNQLFDSSTTIVDMPYAFSIGQWIVYADININNPRSLNFMYNTYQQRSSTNNRNVLSIDFDSPKSTYQIKQTSNPLFINTTQSRDKPIDLVPYMNPSLNQYNPINLENWLIFAQNQADYNSQVLVFQQKQNQSSMQLVYYSDNDSYHILFVDGNSNQSGLNTPSINFMSLPEQPNCSSIPPSASQPKFRRVQIPKSENSYCLQDQINGTLTCDDCIRSNLSTSPANICN